MSREFDYNELHQKAGTSENRSPKSGTLLMRQLLKEARKAKPSPLQEIKPDLKPDPRDPTGEYFAFTTTKREPNCTPTQIISTSM